MLANSEIPLVDKTLTLQNAKARGYRWTMDTILEALDPDVLTNFIAQGLKFGKPAVNRFNDEVGVYDPLKK